MDNHDLRVGLTVEMVEDYEMDDGFWLRKFDVGLQGVVTNWWTGSWVFVLVKFPGGASWIPLDSLGFACPLEKLARI